MNEKLKVKSEKILKRRVLPVIFLFSFLILNSTLSAYADNVAELARAKELYNTGVLQYESNDYQKAESLFKETLAIYQKNLPDDDQRVAKILFSLASIYFVQKRYDEAEPLYERSIEIRKQVFSYTYPELAEASTFLAAIYIQKGKFNDAEMLLSEAYASKLKQYGPDNPLMLNVLEKMRELYHKSGKPEEADAIKQKEEKILAANPQFRLAPHA